VDLAHDPHELEHQLVAWIVGLAAARFGEPLARRAAEHAADVVAAVEAGFGEDPFAGERADVTEEEHLAGLNAGLPGDPARARLQRGPLGLGVVALEPLVALGPALLVLGGAEHDPGVG
jgi:hypothetical protein